MLSETDYLVAWIIYLFGSGILLFLLWQFSRGWSAGILRTTWRFLPAVMLLVPSRADVDQPVLAPAMFVALFEFAMSPDPEAGKMALLRLGYALGVFLVILIALQIRRWRNGVRVSNFQKSD